MRKMKEQNAARAVSAITVTPFHVIFDPVRPRVIQPQKSAARRHAAFRPFTALEDVAAACFSTARRQPLYDMERARRAVSAHMLFRWRRAFVFAVVVLFTR